MAVYSYYSLITKEQRESRAYIVSFPDIENCFTDADTLLEAVEYAQDVLGLMLIDYEDKGIIPKASPAQDIKVPEGASLVLLEVDIDNYREG